MRLLSKEEVKALGEERVDIIEFDHEGQKRRIYIGRPSIESTLWYDDEGESPLSDDPSKRFDGFAAYNMRYNFNDFNSKKWQREMTYWKEHGCCSAAALEHPVITLDEARDGRYRDTRPKFFDYRHFGETDEEPQHVMTDEELKELLAIIAELEERYMKRLRTYWKRYSDHVYAMGYWANR